MDSKLERFLNALEKGAVGTVSGVEKGAVETVKAVHKGAAVTLQALRLGTKSVQDLVDIEGSPLAILNGVVGDSLAELGSEWAIEMELLGKVVGGRFCILVHGLCDSETTWEYANEPSKNYGSQLQQDLGYTPLYVRYNSGLHISTNGQLLVQLIDELYQNATEPIEEIIFIGHSMGGLVVRSACYYAEKNNAPWIKAVKKIFLLGTPHHGNDYEKLGNLTSTILKLVPNLVTFGLAKLGNKRSAGIKDLRFSYLLDEDWEGHDADALWKDNRHPVPLLEGAEYYIIAGSLAKESDNIFTQYFGDGLISSMGATGRSFKKSKDINFLEEHCKTIKGVSHVGLSRSRRVYSQIRDWCDE